MQVASAKRTESRAPIFAVLTVVVAATIGPPPLRANDGADARFEIVDGHLRIQINQASGQAARSARVSVYLPDGTVFASGETDDDGLGVMPAPPRNVARCSVAIDFGGGESNRIPLVFLREGTSVVPNRSPVTFGRQPCCWATVPTQQADAKDLLFDGALGAMCLSAAWAFWVNRQRRLTASSSIR